MNIAFITQFFRLMRTDRFKRFELLLPMKYNDGTEIERLKIDQTTGELGQRFIGLSQDLVRVHGFWRSGGKSYHDKLLRIRIDSTDPKATAFFKSYKETLKTRFQQIDIWITAHEIEII